ncbi:hypothetical protein J3Q64DRAFT_1817545 [Phycomyces blakesleeanus]|uniref:Uncharacterized protein n=1 Tax=Phycomyces blakesleeanus TaxID=4837 RepID=A0ABR3BEW2_PHYBL
MDHHPVDEALTPSTSLDELHISPQQQCDPTTPADLNSSSDPQSPAPSPTPTPLQPQAQAQTQPQPHSQSQSQPQPQPPTPLNVSQQPTSTDSTPTPTSLVQDTPSPVAPADTLQVLQLKAQLAQQQKVLMEINMEKERYLLDTQRLNEMIFKVKEKTLQRQEERKQLEINYDKHLRSLRATNDDTETIKLRLQQLKQNIDELATDLVTHGDHAQATRALRTFWLNLHKSIERMGDPLPPQRIKMLTEKFIMDVLVQNMNLTRFPGLSVSRHYDAMLEFFEIHDPSSSIRLRQELTMVMISKNQPNTDIHQALHMATLSNWKFLYSGLTEAYPFVYKQDKSDGKMYYGSKVRTLVEQAMFLGFAMKGQELDITAAETQEQSQSFDPEFMVDEDGQTAGVVEFCICPPFVVYADHPRPIEKGRVLCFTPPSTAVI